ncbi:MAG: hypothetical protein ACOCR1_01380 [Planctomycetota bacterium]
MNCITASGITDGDRAIGIGKDRDLIHRSGNPLTLNTVEDLLPRSLKNSGRFPPNVTHAVGACAITLEAAGKMVGNGDPDSNVAVLASGFGPTLENNRKYFSDYVKAGRTMGRGNLFIYTLPTSAIAEVSICFGFTGPTFFVESASHPAAELMATATDLLSAREADEVITVWQDANTTWCAFMERTQTELCRPRLLEEIASAAPAWKSPSEALNHFTSWKTDQ